MRSFAILFGMTEMMSCRYEIEPKRSSPHPNCNEITNMPWTSERADAAASPKKSMEASDGTSGPGRPVAEACVAPKTRAASSAWFPSISTASAMIRSAPDWKRWSSSSLIA